MNDINAACAGAAMALSNSEPPIVPSTASIEERLNKLAELRVQGLIDEEEYKARRQKILDEI